MWRLTTLGTGPENFGRGTSRIVVVVSDRTGVSVVSTTPREQHYLTTKAAGLATEMADDVEARRSAPTYRAEANPRR